ncbi:MAG: N-acetylneuraminate synthase family protein [Gammaproteobacteria bacterium]
MDAISRIATAPDGCSAALAAPPVVVAEIGCNHRGEIDTAHALIDSAAAFGGADYVKFQKRTNRELLSPAEYAASHPNPAHSYGATYGEHREFLEFDLGVHRDLMAYCGERGIGYACSAWDLTAAREIASLAPDYIKVPSACNLDSRLLEFLAAEYAGDIHVSLGMTTLAECDALLARLDRHGALPRVVLYACTSGYPVAHEDVCLLEIPALIARCGAEVKAIGFSGHHLGIAIDIAAQALGARWIERHFTLDRTWKGTDHAASLEPDGLRRLVRDTRAVARALHPRHAEILAVEVPQRDKLKRLPGTHFAAGT